MKKQYKLMLILGFMLNLQACKEYFEVPFIDIKADFYTSGDLVQLGTAIAFYQNASEVAQTFAWDFGDGNTSTEKNPTHTYTNTGIFTVKLTATKADGSTSNLIQKTVHILPPTTNTATAKYFGNGEEATGYTFLAENDGFLIVGRKGLNTLWLIRTDLNLNKIAEKEFSNLSENRLSPKLIQRTFDGGYILVGHYQYNQSEEDGFILKLDADLNEQWRNSSTSGRDERYSRILQINNSYWAAGTFTTIVGGVRQSRLGIDIFSENGILLNTIEQGNQWELNDIFFHTNGNYVMAMNENNKPTFLQYNASFSGQLKVPILLNGNSFTGSANAVIPVQQSQDFLIAGEARKVDNNGNAFVARVSDLGVVRWIKELDYFSEKFTQILETKNGEIVLIGTHTNPISGKDIILARFDATGALLKLRLIGGQKDDIFTQAHYQTSTDKLLIGGTTQSFGSSILNQIYFFTLNSALD